MRWAVVSAWLVAAVEELADEQDAERVLLERNPRVPMTMAQPSPQAEKDKLTALGCTVGDEKLHGLRGADYVGCQTLTRSGLTCQSWTEQTPHQHKWLPELYANLGDHNFCRNPYDQDTVWCLTTDPTIRWEYCTPLECGNGKLDTLVGEECDDGNREKGDGCNNKCKIEEGFVCLVPRDVEQPRSYCKRCRNGIREGAEECDDGNSDPFDGCDPYCDQEENWHCRDYKCGCAQGYNAETGDCQHGERDYPCPEGINTGMSDCRPSVCGDGMKWHQEECDDGNLIDFDGCNRNCRIEKGFTCDHGDFGYNGRPGHGQSRCYNCGNDHIDFGEECDDGNEEDGDGCSSTCVLEAGAAYVDEDGLDANGERPANFTCKYGVSTVGEAVEADSNTTADDDEEDEAEGDGRRLRGMLQLFWPEPRALQGVRAETRNTICSVVESFMEKHQEKFMIFGLGGGLSCVLIVFLGYEFRKWHMKKLRLKQGEILVVDKDGKVKKLNTFTAVLTMQIHLKRAIKRRRAAKEMEIKAKEQQDALRKQAQALQEKKWRKQMQVSAARYTADDNVDPL